MNTARERREKYRDNVRYVFGATADLYYETWGDFFHFAIFEPGETATNFDAAIERTHRQYFAAIRGPESRRILELATGGGAFAVWMAGRTRAEVVGVDLSEIQLKRARARGAASGLPNVRFVKDDIMRLDGLDAAPFDAAVFLDAACYLPDKLSALRRIATRLEAGARLLLVDWCRAHQTTSLQEELILEPFYRAWGIPQMETVAGYRRAFDAAGLTLAAVNDLSSLVTANWDRAYRLALGAVSESVTAKRLRTIAAKAMRFGPAGVRLLKEQFRAALLAKAGADAGVIRYVSYLAERQ